MKNYLKKAFLFCSLVAIGYAADASKTVTVTTTNPGRYGYRTKTETHDDGWFSSSHSLTCVDPGTQACTWTTQPLVVNSTTNQAVDCNDIDRQVKEAIATGVLTGTTIQNNVRVNWDANPAGEYTYTIAIP